MRRDFQLPEEDEECLSHGGFRWEAVTEGNTNWLIISDYKIPEGYTHRVADIAIRIPPSYPDDQIDMVYFYQPLALASGKAIKSITPLVLDGKSYQQWSRHRTSVNPWRPGLDNVCTHLIQVDTWLRRELTC